MKQNIDSNGRVARGGIAVIFLLAGGFSFRKHDCSQRSLSSSDCFAPLKHGSVGVPFALAARRRGCNKQIGSSVASTW
jgi:hypothetical protein